MILRIFEFSRSVNISAGKSDGVGDPTPVALAFGWAAAAFGWAAAFG